MKFIITVFAFCLVCVISKAQDAPEHAVFGRQVLDKGESLLLSFSVHAKVMVLKGNCDNFLAPNMPLPRFPSEAIHTGIVGEAVVSFTIKEDGRVDEVHVEKSSYKEFGKESVTAVKQWSFSHPEFRGNPTQLLVRVTFLFSMFEDQS